MREKFWVADTNVIISRLLCPNSVPAQAMRKAGETGAFLISDETMQELVEVLSRSKFDRFLTPEDRAAFLVLFGPLAVRVEIVQRIRACRDPKDDKFIEVAVNGRADAVISGDEDLRAVGRYLNIPILTPREFLDLPLSS